MQLMDPSHDPMDFATPLRRGLHMPREGKLGPRVPLSLFWASPSQHRPIGGCVANPASRGQIRARVHAANQVTLLAALHRSFRNPSVLGGRAVWNAQECVAEETRHAREDALCTVGRAV